MDVAYRTAAVGALLGDPTRCKMLIALLGGGLMAAGTLARDADVSPQTASAHLAKLVEGGLVVVERRGRQRLYGLAGARVASLLESVAAVAPQAGARREPRASRPRDADPLVVARSCYDHLAGWLGVEVTTALVERGALLESDDDFDVTGAGLAVFERLGVDVAAAQGARRHFARRCLDWSERRHHLAGSLGAALLARMLELRWVARRPTGRSLRITHAGAGALESHFGITVPR